MTYFGIDSNIFLFDSKTGGDLGEQIDYNDFLSDGLETNNGTYSGAPMINDNDFPIVVKEESPFDMVEPQMPVEENKNMNEMKVQDYGSLVDMQEPVMPLDLNEDDSSSNFEPGSSTTTNENQPMNTVYQTQMNVGMHRVSSSGMPSMNVNKNVNRNVNIGMNRVNRMNMMNWNNGNGNGNINHNTNELSINGMQWDNMSGIRPNYSVPPVPTPVGNLPLNNYSFPLNMQMNNVTINNVSMNNIPMNNFNNNVPTLNVGDDENNSKKRKSMFETRDLEEDDDYKLPPSKTPIIEAIIYCALKRYGIKIAVQTDAQILFEVTDYETFYEKQKSVCSKQNPTDDECSRIKTIQRWFKNFPTKKEISKSQVTTFKFSVEKSNSEDKFRKIVKIIDKLDCYINVNKRRRTK